MASIPTYDTPQVAPEALPLGRQTSVASPELFDHGAVEQARAGAAITAAGQGLAEIATRMRERDDADSVFRAEVSLKDSYLAQEQDWRQNKQGRFAKGLTQDAQQWWADNIQKHSEALGNDNQRRLFQQRALRYREAGMNSVSTFESGQLERSHDEAWKANKNVTISTAAAALTPEAVDNARLEITKSNRYQAARKGWEPEVLQAENLRDLTALHTQVLQGIAQNNPTAAKEYFEQHKDEIDGARQAELGRFAQQASATAMGERTADAVWQEMGPKFDTEPASLDKMEEALRSRLKGDDFALKAAIGAMRDRVSAFDKGRQEREASTESTVWKAVNQGASLAKVQAMPEYLKLDGKAQNLVREHMETKARQRLAEADSDLGRQHFAAYLKYSDPRALDSMNEDQIINLTPVLGTQLTGNLLEKKRSLGGKVLQASMDAQDFDHVAAEAGLRPFDPSKNEQERAQLGELKYRIENVIDAEQQKAKRPLTREEKMGLMRREFDNQVIVHNTIFPDTKKASILLTPDELKDAYVNVDGQRVNLGTIPLEDRAGIIRGRQQRGLPVSEQAIAETWLRAKQQKTNAEKSSPFYDIDHPKVSDLSPVKAGTAVATGMVPIFNSGVWNLMRLPADALSEYATGPLTKVGILPEDIGAKMAAKFTELAHQQDAVTRDWQSVYMPVQVPKEARPVIEDALRTTHHEVTDENVQKVYKALVKHLQERGQAGAR